MQLIALNIKRSILFFNVLHVRPQVPIAFIIDHSADYFANLLMNRRVCKI